MRSLIASVLIASWVVVPAHANVLDWARKTAKKAEKTVNKAVKTVEKAVSKVAHDAEKLVSNVVEIGDKAIAFVRTPFRTAEELWHQVQNLKLPLQSRWDTTKASVDLSPNMRAFGMRVEDQGKTTTCMAQAASSVFEYMLIGHLSRNPALAQKALGRSDARGLSVSRRHIYWMSRHGMQFCSKGTRMVGSWAAQAMAGLKSTGTFDESLWPFEVWNPHDPKYHSCLEAATNGNPPAGALARSHFFVSSWRYLPGIPLADRASVRRVGDLRGVLAAGYPIIISVFTFGGHQWKVTKENPVVRMPKSITTMPDNAHYVGIFGYDNARQAFLFVNSWGTKWGVGGFGWLPYDYVRRYAIEAAVIRSVGVR